jgi:hypothetical protein
MVDAASVENGCGNGPARFCQVRQEVCDMKLPVINGALASCSTSRIGGA